MSVKNIQQDSEACDNSLLWLFMLAIYTTPALISLFLGAFGFSAVLGLLALSTLIAGCSSRPQAEPPCNVTWKIAATDQGHPRTDLKTVR